MATTPPAFPALPEPIQYPGSTPDPLLSSPDTPGLPPFTPGSSRAARHHPNHHPHERTGPGSPSSYKSASKSARALDELQRRGSGSDDDDGGMRVEQQPERSSTEAEEGFSFNPSASPSRVRQHLVPALQSSPSVSQPLSRPTSSSSLSIVVPQTDLSETMDLVLEGETEDEDEEVVVSGSLPGEDEVRALEAKLSELNVEYGLEEEEGDDEHREMAGLREIYNATAPLLPGIKAAVSVQARIDAQAAELASLRRIIDVQANLNRQVSEEQRAMFDVERDGWRAETQILIAKAAAAASSTTAQPAGKADDKRQSASAATPGHKKESGFEQLDKVEPEDYSKLLKQWMDLQADHRKSIAEKTAMTYKMRGFENQIKALTQELHFLRPIAMNGYRPPQSPTQVKTSPSSRTRTLPPLPVSPSQPSSRRQTLGDARSEHLLLAARRLRTLREKNPEIGLITAKHYKYASLPAPAATSLLPEMLGEGLSDLDEDDLKDRTPRGKGRPKGKKSAAGSMPPPKTPVGLSGKGKVRRKDDAAPPSRTPGGTLSTPGRGFEDLLAAAQSLGPHHLTSGLRDAYAEPPPNMTTPTAAPDSPKRRRVGSSSAQNAWVPGAHPPAAAPQGGEGMLHSSALDLLALASSHDPASPGAPASAARLGGLLGSSSDNDLRSDGGPSIASTLRGLEPAFALRPQSPGLAPLYATQQPDAGPSSTPRTVRLPPDASSPFFSGQTPSALPQRVREDIKLDPIGQYTPTGTTTKTEDGSSTVPARRVRSPYLKWTPDEDELLARGVAKYGQKWDLVSKAVPTRSYHQCRQRWLRKLGMFDHKSAAVTQAASSALPKFSQGAASAPDSPSRPKGGMSDGPSNSSASE